MREALHSPKRTTTHALGLARSFSLGGPAAARVRRKVALRRALRGPGRGVRGRADGELEGAVQ